MEISLSGWTHLDIRPDQYPGRVVIAVHTSDTLPYRYVRHTLVCDQRLAFRLGTSENIYTTRYELLMPHIKARVASYIIPYSMWGGDILPIRTMYVRTRLVFHDGDAYNNAWTAYTTPGMTDPRSVKLDKQVQIQIPGGGRYHWARVDGQLP